MSISLDFTDSNKSSSSLNLESKKTDKTWDEATETWDEQTDTWNAAGMVLDKESKSSVSLSLEDKN